MKTGQERARMPRAAWKTRSAWPPGRGRASNDSARWAIGWAPGPLERIEGFGPQRHVTLAGQDETAVLRWLETHPGPGRGPGPDEESAGAMGLLKLFARPAPTLAAPALRQFHRGPRGARADGHAAFELPRQPGQGDRPAGPRGLRRSRRGAVAPRRADHHYPSLKITARELRGGAIIFLAPKTPLSPMPQS